MGTVTILSETTRNPISVIGERAGVCWGADIGSPEKNYKRGMDCIQSGHGRTLEFVNVEMVLDGYSARVIREWYTHVGGMPTRLQASTRYINYGAFEYVTPLSVTENNIGRSVYENAMRVIREAVCALEAQGVPREDAAMLLPLGMCTRVVDKRNLRSLVDMSRQRMCQRAFWEFRALFGDIRRALMEYSEEWAWIAGNCFYPKCVEAGYCAEKNGCGRYGKRGF